MKRRFPSWLRLALGAILVIALTRCSDMRGSANGSGDDHASTGHIKLGLPF